MLRKITFSDKINTLEISGKYVITADNINEIKIVVNSLVDIVADLQNIKLICKYISIILPETLEDVNYQFEVGYLDNNGNKISVFS